MSSSVFAMAMSYLALLAASFVVATVQAIRAKENSFFWRAIAGLMWGGFAVAYAAKEMSWHLLRNAGAFAIQIGVLIILFRLLLASFRWGKNVYNNNVSKKA